MKSLYVGLIAIGICLGAGLAAGGYFVGQTMYNGRVAVNTAKVKGLAERIVKADQAEWSVGVGLYSNDKANVPQLYKKVDILRKVVIKLLKQEGFKDSDINSGIINCSSREYRDKQNNLKEVRFSVTCSVNVMTSDVERIPAARAKISQLISKGIEISNGVPKYRFTSLNTIKPEMLKEAAKNARIAANEFAKNAGVKVGKIRNARQGGFIIRDVGDDYSDDYALEKVVRVVTNIEFYLTD